MVNRFMTAQSTVATRRWGGPAIVALAAMAALAALDARLLRTANMFAEG